MTLTAPGCGMGEVLVQDVKDKVELVPTVIKHATSSSVFDPPWNQTMMSEAARACRRDDVSDCDMTVLRTSMA